MKKKKREKKEGMKLFEKSDKFPHPRVHFFALVSVLVSFVKIARWDEGEGGRW